jgi:hypothetical protein
MCLLPRVSNEPRWLCDCSSPLYRACLLTAMSVCDDIVERLQSVVLSVEVRMNERLDEVEARIERLREAVVHLQQQAAKGLSRGAGATSREKPDWQVLGGTIAQMEARERAAFRSLLREMTERSTYVSKPGFLSIVVLFAAVPISHVAGPGDECNQQFVQKSKPPPSERRPRLQRILLMLSSIGVSTSTAKSTQARFRFATSWRLTRSTDTRVCVCVYIYIYICVCVCVCGCVCVFACM